MLLKGDSSDMARISRNVPTSNLVRKVQERQSMSKLRQCFWELAGSKLGNILVLRSLQSEVDFKGDAKFAQDMNTRIFLQRLEIEWLQLWGNKLTGVLPPSISNCSKLGRLEMGNNNS
ncbi:pre-mRNA-splicing factor ATP-dependent RNA helicase DEAH7 [Tanacetum coccineum]